MAAEPPDSLPDAIRRADGARRAREAAIAAPPRPPRATNASALDSWLGSMISGLVESTRNAPKGEREITVNNAALRVGGYVYLGADRDRAERELFAASEYNGWVSEEGKSRVEWKIRRGIDDGIKKPNERPDLDAENTVVVSDPNAAPWEPGAKKPQIGKKQATQEDTSEMGRTLKSIRLSTVKSRVPMWVWEYDDVGRIQLGTLSMFAGKPASGKSTAVRWFAARLSKGELPGVWFDNPVNVALVMSEEQTDAVVVPGLVAADADLQNIYIPQFNEGSYESAFNAQRDEQAVTEFLLTNQIRALFVDPVMSTVGGKADMYRNNEVREMLAPFTRIARAINGIVVAVTHLKKGQVHDVLDSVHSSSAFGEVPRAVFGFAPMQAGEHVFEQVKNSAGPTGLKLAYQLPVSYVETDDGQSIDLPRFQITGTTDISISDINSDSDETTGISAAMDWLKMYLLVNQPAASAELKREAKSKGDIGARMIGRAAQRLDVKIFPRSEPGKPYTTVWCLPDYMGSP